MAFRVSGIVLFELDTLEKCTPPNLHGVNPAMNAPRGTRLQQAVAGGRRREEERP